MANLAVLVLTGLIYTALLIAVLFVFFYTAYKVLKLLPKAEKAIDTYLEKNSGKPQEQGPFSGTQP